MPDQRNYMAMVLISVVTLFVWNYFFMTPIKENQKIAEKALATHAHKDIAASMTRVDAVNLSSHRIKIETPSIQGSINLEGARFDDIILTKYKENVQNEEMKVALFSPLNAIDAYFADIGWISTTHKDLLPNKNTIWQTNHDVLTVSSPVTLTWDNEKGLLFTIDVSVDEDYLFTITQKITSYNGFKGEFSPYGLISKITDKDINTSSIVHEGFTGMFDNILVEKSYKDIEKIKKESWNSNGGWLGISDKYWLASFIPEQRHMIKASFSRFVMDNKKLRFQLDYMGQQMMLLPNGEISYTQRLYAGSKDLDILERVDAPKFDHAVDFGVLYFITKPLAKILDKINVFTGNFGLAIIVLTFSIKLILFPLANKSHSSMYKMKKLQPVIENLRKRHSDDKIKLNQEIMRVYKNSGVNPLSGCFPIVAQIPVFFALYKVLMISIEMRHAPFYGWINDLSAPDPTSILNLFGLLNWNTPPYLHIGAWPIIMAITMFVQQKFNPKPADPMQAKMMSFMPLIFLFMFSNFPAGLIIYWAFNNILTILQQCIINVKMKKAHD